MSNSDVTEMFELPEHWPRVEEDIDLAVTIGEIERPALRPIVTNGRRKTAGHVLMLDRWWIALGPRGRGYGVYKHRATAVCAVISCYKLMLAESIRLRADEKSPTEQLPENLEQLPLVTLEELDQKLYKQHRAGKKETDAYWADFHYGPEAQQRRINQRRAERANGTS